MKHIFSLLLIVVSTQMLNAQDFTVKKFLGKWYQCEPSDGKVIKLTKHKCYTESLNEDNTRLLSEVYELIDWDFNVLGHYSIKNHFNDSLNSKGKWRHNQNKIVLDGVNYIIAESVFDFWAEKNYEITLVREDYWKLYQLIDSQTKQLRQLLSDDWMIVPIDSGFSVYYNKGQNVKFEHHFNYQVPSVRTIRNEGDTLSSYVKKEPKDSKIRELPHSYYTENDISPDSICWFTNINGFYRNGYTNEELRKSYPKNGVLKIDVTFQPKWSNEKVNEIQIKNDTLKNKILEIGLHMSNESIFHDYRYWLPIYWQQRLAMYDYYFERLPYKSELVNNYSIFINPNVKCFFCEPLYVDESDTLYFTKDENHLEAERQRTIRIIALSLGIKDFEIVDSYSAFPVEPK